MLNRVLYCSTKAQLCYIPKSRRKTFLLATSKPSSKFTELENAIIALSPARFHVKHLFHAQENLSNTLFLRDRLFHSDIMTFTWERAIHNTWKSIYVKTLQTRWSLYFFKNCIVFFCRAIIKKGYQHFTLFRIVLPMQG